MMTRADAPFEGNTGRFLSAQQHHNRLGKVKQGRDRLRVFSLILELLSIEPPKRGMGSSSNLHWESFE